MKVVTAHVPCNGCTACCHGDLVFIHPECGDVASDYETMPMTHPITGMPGLALKHKGDSCIYLGEKGCTIHPRRPSMCREFDCRRFYLSMDRAERRRRIRTGQISKDVMQAAKERLHTLGETDEMAGLDTLMVERGS